jgi:PTH1 family peptidyl-tRNA hydrolase
VPLVLGLGNPGARYAHTRHNVGWDVVETLVARWKASPHETTATYRAWRAGPGGREIDLVVPLTFMNRSGEALDEWRSRHDLGTGDLLVVVDDVYLSLGRIRLRASGSSGGHNGLASLEGAIGSRDWSRLRIGIGAAGSAAGLRDHVLEGYAPDELPVIAAAIGRAADAAECWCLEGLTKAMNRFNRSEEEEVQES